MNNGICEYVIAAIVDHDIRYWVGKTRNGKMPELSSCLADAKRYDDTDKLREDLETILRAFALGYKILEIQRCPKCKKEYTEHSALSREDNETEICPECGVREAIEIYLEARNK